MENQPKIVEVKKTKKKVKQEEKKVKPENPIKVLVGQYTRDIDSEEENDMDGWTEVKKKQRKKVNQEEKDVNEVKENPNHKTIVHDDEYEDMHFEYYSRKGNSDVYRY